MDTGTTGVDRITIIGLGLLLVPVLTMWHEIGGHAAACIVQGGRIATLGAFYVDCEGLVGGPYKIMAAAGAFVDVVLSTLAYVLWMRARSDLARLVLWYVWVSKGFTATGYLLFSGVSGVGDFSPVDGAMTGFGPPLLLRLVMVVVGGTTYFLVVRKAFAALTVMIGDTPQSLHTRRDVSLVFYAAAGISAVMVGLLNPVGIAVTLMSAAASSFGGLAGYIAVGRNRFVGSTVKSFGVARSWAIASAGLAVTAAFAVVLGPSVHFA